MDHADERIVRMQKALVAFLNATGEYHENRLRESSADPMMSHDILAFGDSRPFHNAVTLSDLAFHYTHSHLSLLAAAIAQSCEPLTCCTLVRSTLETAAIGAWVVDPTAGTAERAARVFSIRFDSIVQNIKVLQCTRNIKDSDIDQTKARKEVLAQQADAFGIPVGRDNGKVLWVGRRKPGATDMISDVLDDEWMYRLLSSVAHGHHWALRQLGFAEVTSATPSTTDGRMFEPRSFPEAVMLVTLHGALAYARLIWNTVGYRESEMLPIEETLENAMDGFNASIDLRFWRSQ